MEQQTPGSQDAREPSPNLQQQAQESRPSKRDADSTWGIGSASALDSLRRQNFRGKRQSPASDTKPSSE
jgi:hypothetical protein